MDAKNLYTMDDLVGITGLPRRTIRFYIERGLLDPPAGRGRGGFYDASHVARLLEIKKSRKEGRSLKSIRSIEPMEFQNRLEAAIGGSTVMPDTFPAGASILLSWELAPGLSLQVEETLFAKNRNLIHAIISTVRSHKDTARTLPERKGDIG
jgi:DNA-binding transcriptional MerR regulator